MALVTILPCLLCRKPLPPVPADHEEHLEEEHKVKFHINWIVRKTLKERRKPSEVDNDEEQSKEDLMETDAEMEDSDMEGMYFPSDQSEKIGKEANSTNEQEEIEKLLEEENDDQNIEMGTNNAVNKELNDSTSTRSEQIDSKCCAHCSNKLPKNEEMDQKDIEIVATNAFNKAHVVSSTPRPEQNNSKCCPHYCEDIHEKSTLPNGEASHMCNWDNWCDDILKQDQKKMALQNKIEIVKYICTWQGCEKMSARKDDLKQHLMTHQVKVPAPSPYISHLKKSPVSTNSRMDKMNQHHLLTQSGDKRVFKCDNCPKQFSRIDTLKKHKIGCSEIEIIQIEEKRYNCPKCGKQFLKENNLKQHLIGCYEVKVVPVAVKKQKCDKCDQQFLKEDKLKQHKIRCRGIELNNKKDKKYKGVQIKKIQKEEKKTDIEKCIQCKKEFSKEDLKKHEIDCLKIDQTNVRQSSRRRSSRVNYCEDED